MIDDTRKDIHICEFMRGKIKDVTFGETIIRCRRCERVIPDSHVDPQDLYEIKKIQERKYGNKRN